jgi:hypothetical protein
MNKHDWKRIIEEPVSREAQDRMFAAADHFIDENLAPARGPSWLERLFAPAFSIPLAAGAAAVAVFFLISVPRQAAMPEVARIEPELIQNLEILLELETLEHWEPGKQASESGTKWKKERT